MKVDLKDVLLVMLFANKKKTTNPYCLSYPPWSQETIPTSQVSLASTLCTQGLFTPFVGVA